MLQALRCNEAAHLAPGSSPRPSLGGYMLFLLSTCALTGYALALPVIHALRGAQ